MIQFWAKRLLYESLPGQLNKDFHFLAKDIIVPQPRRKRPELRVARANTAWRKTRHYRIFPSVITANSYGRPHDSNISKASGSSTRA